MEEQLGVGWGFRYRGSLVPNSNSWWMMSGESGSKILCTSQVAINGVKGGYRELMEPFDLVETTYYMLAIIIIV